ncbi:MAG: 4-hydroxythreonine-4-phosphate dehydrogenase PdxA, partial [Cyanobacteria bacterium REEB65]|nr:4-hydroxythreonine-4-phosphate dehydrogenase PdxA [Cyanobacteria bacterium REEB65]
MSSRHRKRILQSEMPGNMAPRLALTYGDPAGIGPEILARALAGPLEGAQPVVYGDRRILARGADVTGVRLPLVEIRPVPWDGGLPKPAAPNRETGAHAFAVLEALGADLLAKRVDGVVTGPIQKAAVVQSQPSFIGHTEFFAELAGVRRFGMLLVVEPFRALHVTGHMALVDALRRLDGDRVRATLELAGQALERLGEARRTIGVCGLNPHAGEGGLFGDEEARYIEPAIAIARSHGLDVEGPLPPDTAFVRAAKGEFGVVVCMYHDQGHIPLKLMGFDRGVNMTVGLPFVRTSV